MENFVKTAHSVVITEIYSHTFLQKFRETSIFTKARINDDLTRYFFGESKSFILQHTE